MLEVTPRCNQSGRCGIKSRTPPNLHRKKQSPFLATTLFYQTVGFYRFSGTFPVAPKYSLVMFPPAHKRMGMAGLVILC
jgi:hypothetical protein